MRTSTRTDLLPVYGERPPVIEQDGWRIYVSIHDQAYLTRKRELRSKVISSHPDKGGTSNKFRLARARLMGFMQQERSWYWKIGLMPPDWKGAAAPPHGWRETTDRSGTAQGTMRRMYE